MAKQKRKQFQTPTGMRDILPDERYVWNYVYRVMNEIAQFYNFGEIDIPTLEETELFEKGTGQGTDIVQKEMFSLKTKGGTSLTLRPEGTPSVVRAYIQNGMKKWSPPVKLQYYGPMYRHERPQQGRYRQFYQFGLETIGENDPIRDVEIIHVMYKILERLRIKDVVVEVNSIGCSVCREKYLKSLKGHYRYRLKQVCADCRKRYQNQPLRMLDCEEEKCQRIKSEAPHVLDYLCSDCNTHFKKVLDVLDFLNIPYLLNPHLVRGLDYYTRTVFEIYEGDVDDATTEEDADEKTGQKRTAIASGGRYDNLVEFLGGEPTPAVGGAIGVDRLIDVIKKNEKEPQKTKQPQVFFVQLGDMARKKSFYLFEEFRKAGIPIQEALGRGSISSQLKVANRVGVNFAIIMGQKEVMDKVALVREMDSGVQEVVPEDKLVEYIKKRLKKK